MIHFLRHFFGIDNLSGAYYGFWSGVGSDITELALIGALWRHFNCHQRGCLRIGRHPHGPYKLCKKHHPLVPDQGPTAEHIKESA